jgi:hypothetical protein
LAVVLLPVCPGVDCRDLVSKEFGNAINDFACLVQSLMRCVGMVRGNEVSAVG